MTLTENTNNMQSNGLESAQKFTIAANGSIFATLSSRLYTKPIQAIVREIYSNAIDANIVAKTDKKAIMHLPTSLEATFSVQDFGIGMSDEQIYNVYTRYGSSLKDGDNQCIGGLGLGSKTPFAYTKQFTIESIHDGIYNSYICFMDKDSLPSITHIDTHPEPNKSGTTISFAVDAGDMNRFAYEAVQVLLFAQQMPILTGAVNDFLQEAYVSNLAEFEDLRLELASKSVLNYSYTSRDSTKLTSLIRKFFEGKYIVEMGGVAYEVDNTQLDQPYISCNQLFPIVLHMPIGSVAIQASREKLNYTKDTVQLLNHKIAAEVYEFCYNEIVKNLEVSTIEDFKALSFATKIGFYKSDLHDILFQYLRKVEYKSEDKHLKFFNATEDDWTSLTTSWHNIFDEDNKTTFLMSEKASKSTSKSYFSRLEPDYSVNGQREFTIIKISPKQNDELIALAKISKVVSYKFRAAAMAKNGNVIFTSNDEAYNILYNDFHFMPCTFEEAYNEGKKLLCSKNTEKKAAININEIPIFKHIDDGKFCPGRSYSINALKDVEVKLVVTNGNDAYIMQNGEIGESSYSIHRINDFCMLGHTCTEHVYGITKAFYKKYKDSIPATFVMLQDVVREKFFEMLPKVEKSEVVVNVTGLKSVWDHTYFFDGSDKDPFKNIEDMQLKEALDNILARVDKQTSVNGKQQLNDGKKSDFSFIAKLVGYTNKIDYVADTINYDYTNLQQQYPLINVLFANLYGSTLRDSLPAIIDYANAMYKSRH